MKRKIITLLVLIATVLTGCSFMKDDDVKPSKPSSAEKKVNNESSEAVDVIANDEKIIEMLKKSGKIPKDATPEEIRAYLKKYLQNKGQNSVQDQKEKAKYIQDLKDKIQKDLKK